MVNFGYPFDDLKCKDLSTAITAGCISNHICERILLIAEPEPAPEPAPEPWSYVRIALII